MPKIGEFIEVNDLMQCGYRYKIETRAGRGYDRDFKPEFSPKQMLEAGVFEGKYLNDCRNEFPEGWFKKAKISDLANPSLNYFGIKSRQSLQVWRRKQWIIEPDPRGWFQWYCRYYQGRRIEEVDRVQIKRWKGFRRHAGQIRANCKPGDLKCRPRQRQALLQWAHDAFI